MARPRDVSEFAERQQLQQAPALIVSTDQVSAVGAARRAGGQSSGMAGQYARTAGPPSPSFENVNDVDYLLDLNPNAFGKRMLALDTVDDQSQGMSVVAAYQTRDAEEHGTPAQITGGEEQGPWDRQHMLLIQFGTANSPSVVEVDIVEGMALNIPGAKCEVTLLDYTFSRKEQADDNNLVRTHCSAANGAISTRAQMTQMVFCPFQIDIDLANPPTFSELKSLLIEANTLGHLLTVGVP